MPEQYPQLRAVLQFCPVETEGGDRLLALIDPTGLVEDHIVFRPQMYRLFQLLDGQHSLKDIQKQWRDESGEATSMKAVRQFVRRLDDAHFLVSDRFDRYVDGLREAYEEAEWRESRMAGEAYPADPVQLRRLLDSFFEHEDGPGRPEPGARTEAVRGLIAPHIDLQAGAGCYAAAYKALAESPAPRLFVVLGTDHFGWHRFTATRKGFQTPLGPVETDQTFLDALQDRLTEPLFEDEFKHEWEHSIEFQALWLRFLFPDEPVRIVPIMCGGFADAIMHRRSPGHFPDVVTMCRALRELIELWPDPVCIIASADLAHLGLRFGSEQPVSRDDLPAIEAEDRALMEHMVRLDPEQMAHVIFQQDDARGICGFPPIYIMLKALTDVEGEFLDYGQSFEPEAGSCVTFGAVAYH
jgi:AmmeMemoRadiSam system protein B